MMFMICVPVMQMKAHAANERAGRGVESNGKSLANKMLMLK